MPATQSKEAGGVSEERRQEQRRQIGMLLRHIALNVGSNVIPIQVQPQVCSECFAGDFARAGAFMGMTTAATALLEFAFNPTVGCWGDDHGRKPW